MSSAAFHTLDWALVSSVALMWGSSFFFMKEALHHFHSGAVVFLRVAFGAVTLATLHLLVHRRDVRGGLREYPAAVLPGCSRLVVLALLWMALPLSLAAIAQQWVGTGLAGMIFASPPIWSTLVNAVLTRAMPARVQIAGLACGFLGVVLILWPTLTHGASSSALGLMLMVISSFVVGVGSCVGAPLQRKAMARAGPLGFLASLVLMAAISTLLCLPFGAYGLVHSTFGWRALAAEAALGGLSTGVAYSTPQMASRRDPSPLGWPFQDIAHSDAPLGGLSTGVAYLCVAVVVGRVGPARGLLGNYFLPVVSTVEGCLLYGESLQPLALLGAGVVTVGAWLTSRKGVASGAATGAQQQPAPAAHKSEEPSSSSWMSLREESSGTWDMRTLPGVALPEQPHGEIAT